MNMHNIHLARPDMWPIVIGIIIGTSLISLYRLRKTAYVADMLDATRSKKSLLYYSYTKKIIKCVALCISSILLALILLRPQGQAIKISAIQEGRDVLIALDISRSMLAQDLKPNRLQYAKDKITLLLKQLTTDRVGLMLFSGSTFVQCPLTSDTSAFSMFLDGVDAETISSGTTAIEGAINQAIGLVERMPERKSKLLVIFTDGEDFSSNLAATKTKAAALGLHIVTVGVGTIQGAPIPLYDRSGKQTGHQTDAKGAIVISRMNEGILIRIAQDTGGIFVPISTGTQDIQAIQKYITSYEKELLADKQVEQFQEQYQWLLLLSFCALIVEWLL